MLSCWHAGKEALITQKVPCLATSYTKRNMWTYGTHDALWSWDKLHYAPMRFSSCGAPPTTLVAKTQGCHGSMYVLECDNLFCLHSGLSLQDSPTGDPDWFGGAKW